MVYSEAEKRAAGVRDEIFDRVADGDGRYLEHHGYASAYVMRWIVQNLHALLTAVVADTAAAIAELGCQR